MYLQMALRVSKKIAPENENMKVKSTYFPVMSSMAWFIFAIHESISPWNLMSKVPALIL